MATVGVINRLRGLGPRVFLSYGYDDASMAGALAGALGYAGCRVQMESVSSLVGRPLDDALAERIASAEVFVQLLTDRSAQSEWLARELELATQPGSRCEVVIPIVVGQPSVPEAVSRRGYLPAGDALEQETIEAVVERALSVIELVPLEPDAPYDFSAGDLDHLSASDRPIGRVLVDSGCLLDTALDATMAWAGNAGGKIREQVTRQQERERRRIDHLLLAVDAFLPPLLRCVRPLLDGWLPGERPRLLRDIVRRFGRLTLGREAVRLGVEWEQAARQAWSETALASCRQASERVTELSAPHRGDLDYGWIVWAVDDGNRVEWRHLGFDAVSPGSGAHAWLPLGELSDTTQLVFQVGAKPEAEITAHDWVLCAVPQVAAQAVKNLREPAAAEDAAREIGWRLADYRNVGWY